MNSKNLPPRAIETFEAIKKLEPVSRSELATCLVCSPNTVSQYVMMLSHSGLIRTSGKGRFSKWSIAPKENKVRVQSIREYAKWTS
jgi:predicted transcriptional regulator